MHRQLQLRPCGCWKCVQKGGALRAVSTIKKHMMLYGPPKKRPCPRMRSQDEEDRHLRRQQGISLGDGVAHAPRSEKETQSGTGPLHLQQDRGFDSGNTELPDPIQEDLVNDQENLYDVIDEVCSSAGGGGNHLREDPKLYEGCSMGRLTFIFLLQNIKTMSQWSDASVNMLLRLLKEKVLPEKNNAPASVWEMKKAVSEVGLEVQHIDACVGDCILFRGEEYANLDSCPKCNEPRYHADLQGPHIARKVLRYMPLSARIVNMFANPSIAAVMDSHVKSRNQDEMKSVHDSEVWRHSEEILHLQPRDVRLGMCIDPVNPYSLRNTCYSVCPVFMINYNLPTTMQTKKANMILTMIIPGKYQPTNMQVYLRPLLEELSILWTTGVRVRDSSRPGGQYLQVKVVNLWTITDSPGLQLCSGFVTSGKHACFTCAEELTPRYSASLSKTVYTGFRKLLPMNHPFRTSLSYYFNGRPDLTPIPKKHTIEEWQAKWNSRLGTSIPGMHYLSCFYALPYWVNLHLHHLVDSMHVIKNVSCSLLLHIVGEKDTPQSREDMRIDNSKMELWEPNAYGEYEAAPWVLSREQQLQFFAFISSVKTPTGFGAELSNSLNKKDHFSGLKSHDYVNILRYFVPIAMRRFVPPGVLEAVSRLSRLIRWITSKRICKSVSMKMLEEATVVLSLLEMQFPTSFFDSQVHSLYHVVQEIQIAGPIENRNMFFVERFLKTLKNFVRQQARPEGSMVEGYITQEAIGRCQEATEGLREYTTAIWEDEEDPKEIGEVLVGNGKSKRFGGPQDVQYKQVNTHMVMTSIAMTPWVEKYNEVKRQYQEDVAFWRSLKENRMRGPHPVDPGEILEWIREAVREADESEGGITEEVLNLAAGCFYEARSYNAMWAYGRYFRVNKIDEHLKRCDSGVAGRFEEGDQKVDYIGLLVGILEVEYPTLGKGQKNKVILFLVEWYKNNVRFDDCLFHAIDTSQTCGMDCSGDQPFIFPKDVEKVFFAADRYEDGWYFVLQHRPKTFNVFEYLEVDGFDDGRHVTGLHSGQERESSEDEEDELHERESLKSDASVEETDDEDLDSVQRVTSQFDDEFRLTTQSLRDIALDEQEDSDYEQRKTRQACEGSSCNW